jgi:predicted dehydrogenase
MEELQKRPGLRIGIAGTGFVGRIHAAAARAAGARLIGVAASRPERSRTAAAELGAERAFGSAEELLASPDVDVVHICVPNHLHVPLVEAAIAAGKRVVCEKPLAPDAASAWRLAQAAEDGGGGFVPFVYRYYPTLREARERVRRGAIGAVHLLHGTYLQDWLLAPEDDNWRVDAKLGGPSRAFADIGSHWCDLAEFVSGDRIVRLCARTLIAVPSRVRGEGRIAFERRPDAGGERREVDTEDAAIVQFETGAGAIGALVVSQVSAGRKNRLWLEVDGAEETLVFDQENPETLWRGRREMAIVVPRDPTTLTPEAARLATLPGGHPQGYRDCFDGFVGDAYAAIRGGEPADGLPTFADGARAAEITEAVLSSSRSETWVEVGSGEQTRADGV